MYKNRLNNIIAGLLGMLAVSSCVRDTSMDSGEAPVVVVECVLTESSPQTLRLTLGKAPSASVAPTLQNAEARLYDQTDGIEAGFFERGEDNEWTLDYAAVPEHSYRLEVRVPGYELIWAEQTMPHRLKLVCYRTPISDLSSNDGDKGSMFSTSELPDYTWVYAMNYDRDKGTHYIAEQICTNYRFVDNFNINGAVYLPPAGPDYYDSIFDRYFPTRLYPSLENFAMHNRYLRLLKVEGEMEPEYMTFRIGGGFEGDYYTFIGPTVQYPEEPAEDEGYLLFMAVTDEYDQYLRDAIRFQQLDESTDLSTTLIRDNPYSNIIGGVGIFGAVIEQKVPWSREYTVIVN